MWEAGRQTTYFARGSDASRSARTASSVSFAAVTPIRSKQSATMLFDAVKRVMSKSIGVTDRRR
jgi:hypothetical protein